MGPKQIGVCWRVGGAEKVGTLSIIISLLVLYGAEELRGNLTEAGSGRCAWECRGSELARGQWEGASGGTYTFLDSSLEIAFSA